MDSEGLGAFLRTRREALRPADVGLVAGPRRRTPGLRRDEVALLASMSSDYYERIEQGRSAQPSPAMLAAIARALRLTLDERDHLFVLAGQAPPAAHAALGHWADPGLLTILDALDPSVPGLVTDDLGTVVAQTPSNVALLGRIAGLPGRAANFTWRWFTDAAMRRVYLEDREALGRGYVADLRAAVARRGPDAEARDLVAALLDASDEFRALWALHEVAVRRSTRKVLQHPDAGRIDCQCDVVLSPQSGQRLVLFRGSPGTDAADRLAMLAVIGSQDLRPTA